MILSDPSVSWWSLRALWPAAVSLFLLAGCGHVVFRAPNHGGLPFDLKRPPCAPREPAPQPDLVSVRYLGAGGLAVEWQGETLLGAPFFSNYGLFRVGLGRLRPDERAIAGGLARLQLSRVGAILAAHSHYDHLGDLPVVASLAPGAKVYVNNSGFQLLQRELPGRLVPVEPLLGRWIQMEKPDGSPAPIRFLAVRSEHAPHIFRYLWGRGEVPGPLATAWERTPIRRLRAGQPLAFVIDLQSADRRRVLFRIYYQDSAASAGQGVPPTFTGADAHPYDLAVLCVASFNRVQGTPGGILRSLRPRHVLAIHYEDFFRPRSKPLRFVTLLTDGLVQRYLTEIESRIAGAGRGPVGTVCGPSGSQWTMPLPGELIHFRPEQ